MGRSFAIDTLHTFLTDTLFRSMKQVAGSFGGLYAGILVYTMSKKMAAARPIVLASKFRPSSTSSSTLIFGRLLAAEVEFLLKLQRTGLGN